MKAFYHDKSILVMNKCITLVFHFYLLVIKCYHKCIDCGIRI